MRSSNFTLNDRAVQSQYLCRQLRIERLYTLCVGLSATVVRNLGRGPKPTLSLPLLLPLFSFLAPVRLFFPRLRGGEGEASATIWWCLCWSPRTCSQVCIFISSHLFSSAGACVGRKNMLASLSLHIYLVCIDILLICLSSSTPSAHVGLN